MTNRNAYEAGLIKSLNKIKVFKEKGNSHIPEELINSFAISFINYATNVSMVSFKNNRCIYSVRDVDTEIRQQLVDDACMKVISKLDTLTSMKEDEVFRYIRTVCNNKIKDAMKSGLSLVNSTALIIDESNEDGSAKYQFEAEMNIEKQIENENSVYEIFNCISEELTPFEAISVLSEFNRYKPGEIAAQLIEYGERRVLLEMLKDSAAEFSYIDLTAFGSLVSKAEESNRFCAMDTVCVASKVSHAKAKGKAAVAKALKA